MAETFLDEHGHWNEAAFVAAWVAEPRLLMLDASALTRAYLDGKARGERIDAAIEALIERGCAVMLLVDDEGERAMWQEAQPRATVRVREVRP